MEVVVFDLETTGLAPERDSIIEIGAFVVRHGELSGETFHSLIYPGRSIPSYVTRIHGIHDGMVKDAPRLIEVMPKFLEFVAGRTLVAHNAGFDMGFLKTHSQKLGLQAPHQYQCTMELSRRVFPAERRHNLDALCGRLGLYPSTRHRALADAEMTAHAFVALNKMLELAR